MKQIITDVQSRLQSNAPLLKYVDEDWGQLDYYAERPPVKWPCGLIDFASGSFTNEGKLVQLGLLQVKIRVADMRISNSSGAAPQAQKDKSYSFFDVLESVHTALHGWSGDESYSKLIRTGFAKVKRNDGVRLYEITFTTQWVDDSATGVQNTKPVTKLAVTITRQ